MLPVISGYAHEWLSGTIEAADAIRNPEPQGLKRHQTVQAFL